MIDMPQFSHPLQPQRPPLPRPVALTWSALTEGHWSVVVTKDTGSVAASLSPVEHAWSNNREYLIGALEDGWCSPWKSTASEPRWRRPSLPKRLLESEPRRWKLEPSELRRATGH
jgi:hypothetical protein